MSKPDDHHQMQLDSHILAFLKARQAQDGPPLWALSSDSARKVLHSC
jgi:hypothetical protein